MPVTIKEVAQEAQVSIATVSRVINNKGYISSETREKVTFAMKKLNYMPNIAARTLQGKHTATIGVILPSMDNPLYAELFENIEQNLSRAHFQTLLCTSNNQSEKELEYISLLKANQVEGIITSSHSDFLTRQVTPTYPIVCFDRFISKDIPSVKSDNLNGGMEIARRVISRKCKRVLILSGSKEDFYPVNDRIKGMLNVFNRAGVDITTSAFDFESSMNVKKILTKKLIVKREYDAICCTDDLTALMVLTVAGEMNYSPMVTGYDGSKFIRTFFPSLLTAKQPISEMAELMCDLLLKKIKKPKTIFESEYVFQVSLTK